MAFTITNAAELNELASAPRAVVLLTADYAYTGAYARRVFERVSEAFPHYFPHTDVRFFLLEEIGPWRRYGSTAFPYLTSDPHRASRRFPVVGEVCCFCTMVSWCSSISR
jgi:hypothetical protein